MKLNIFVNKYLLIWEMLFQSSLNEEVHELKLDLWNSHKKEYSEVFKEKTKIIKDMENFIADDDIIYTAFETAPFFKKIKKETNKYRNVLLSMWDSNREKYVKEINNILRTELEDTYNICVIHSAINMVETDTLNKLVIVGKKIEKTDKDDFLTYLIYKLIKSSINFGKCDQEIIDIILELAIINELYTRISKESKYNLGKKENREIKQKIYPYFLMYLGVEKEDLEKYMIRDNIFFDINNYTYENKLRDMDIVSFTKFICKYKKEILNKKITTVEDIEIL